MRLIDLQKISYGIVAILLTIIVLGSCTTSPKSAQCLGDNYDGLILRWGTHNFTDTIIDGFQLDEFGTVNKIYKEGLQENFDEVRLGRIDEDRLCELIGKVNEVVIRTQVYFVKVEYSHYIEYYNPKTNFGARAVWNPKMARVQHDNVETYGSKGYMDLYDTLNKVVRYEIVK